MNSELLKSLGIPEIDLAYYILGFVFLYIIFLIIVIIQGKKIKKTKKTYEAFIKGKDGKSLEEIMLRRFEEIDELKSKDTEKTHKINEILKTLEGTFQKTGMVKYNAFNEMGGKLSFALALLNEKDSGFLLNVIHSREGCYTYVKEIQNGISKLDLGEEESKALTTAMTSKE